MSHEKQQNATTAAASRGALRAITTISGAAALVLGLLYGAGAVTRAGQFAAAGYSVQDTLPLVPLPQVLTTGLALIFDPAVMLAGLALAFLALSGYTQVSMEETGSTPTPDQRKLDRQNAVGVTSFVIHELSHTPGVTHKRISELASRLETLSASAAEITDDNPLVQSLVSDIETLASDSLHDAKTWGLESEWIGDLRKRRRSWRRHAVFSVIRKYRIWGIVTLLTGSWALLFAQIPSIPFLIGQYWWVLFAVPGARTLSRIRRRILLSLPFILAVITSAYLDTRPLQRVEVFYPSTPNVIGRLVAQSGDGKIWYVGASDGSVEALEIGGEVRARLSRPSTDEQPYDNKTLWSIIFN